MHFMRGLRLLVYPALLALCWQSLGVNNFLYAFDGSSPKEAAAGVAEWEGVNRGMLAVRRGLGEARDALLAGAGAAVLQRALAAPAADLDQAVETLRAFQDAAVTSAIARGASEEVIARIDAPARAFQSEARALLADLYGLMSVTRVADAIALIDNLLQRLPPPPTAPRPVLNPDNLPYRLAEPPADLPLEAAGPDAARAAASSRSVSAAGELSSVTEAFPSEADLQEDGIEVVFDPMIEGLAAELGHNAMRIYEYVRNEIDFEPTYGSIKGAVGTLASKSGNAFDQASLLVALLRASGIPARYEVGTIQLAPEQATGWVGVQDPSAAGTLLASGGIPAVTVVDAQSSAVLHLRVEHVWVRAYVDYTPSRGGVNQVADRWVRLDPSFKQYDVLPGEYDFDGVLMPGAESLRDQIQASGTTNPYGITGLDRNLIQTSVGEAVADLGAHIQAMPPEVMADLIGAKRKIKKAYGILPATASYTYAATPTQTYAEVPNDKRHRVTFTLSNLVDDPIFGPQKTADFTYSEFMPRLAARRVTLAYAPADTASESYLVSLLPTTQGLTVEQTIAATPTSLNAPAVRLHPQLRVDGVTVAQGGSVGLGRDQGLDIAFSSPGGYANGLADNTIAAGSTNAIVLDLGAMTDEYVATRRAALNTIAAQVKYDSIPDGGINSDAVYGEMLYLSGLRYWQQLRLVETVAQRQLGVTATAMPRAGIFSHNLHVVSSCVGFFCTPTPQVVSSGGMGTDIDHNIVAVVADGGDGTADAAKRRVDYMIMTGVMSSYLEGNIYTQGFARLDESGGGSYGAGAISTAHILGYANAQGMPVYTVDSTNIGSVLPLLSQSAEVVNAVQSSVAAGKTVIIPRAAMDVGWWHGTGYAVIDPGTGAGAYMISGGTGGGGEDLPTLDPMTSFLIGALLLGIGIFAGPVLGVILAVIGIAMALYDLYANVHNIQNNPNLTQDQKDAISGLYVMMAVIGVILAVGGVFLGAVGAFVAVALYFLYISIMVSLIMGAMIGILSARNQQLNDILNGVDARDFLNWGRRTLLAGPFPLPGRERPRSACALPALVA